VSAQLQSWRICSRSRILLPLALSLLATSWSGAQTQPYERTVRASKAEVETALRTIHAASGGKLPLLEGFVAAGENALDRYRQPYYQYSIQVRSISATETVLRVTANITAWYVDDDASKSAYRSLASNGRLENDLFERLAEALPGKIAGQPAAAPNVSARDNGGTAVPGDSVGTLPDAASAAKSGSIFRSPSVSTPAPNARDTASAPDTATEKRIQQLKEDAKNLDEILHNQSRPDNLAVVKESKTPIFSRPLPGAKILFLADAEDEFQILETQADWVHVQVTSLLRGWIRRGALDLSAVSARLLSSGSSSGSTNQGVFQQTREETATFPGQWEPLRGKKVKIIWVQSNESRQDPALDQRATFAKSVFRKAYPALSRSADKVEGIVIIFDAADGGMAAATVAALQRLNTGELSDSAFWKQCWLDPPEAFKDR
jgi:hypothetical protein